MKKIFIVLSLILIICFGITLLIHPGISPLIHNKLILKYENTEGGKFLNNLKTVTTINDDSNLLTAVPYEVNLYFNKTKLNLSNKLLHKYNRYYVPITEFSKCFGQAIVINDEEIQISNDVILNISDKSYKKDDKTISLRGDLPFIDSEYYISFSDICEILNLSTYWSYKNNNIYINKNNGPNSDNLHKPKKKHKKDAYIRFEDVAAGDVYAQQDTLEKLRIITDYMYEESQNFSVAWVPRYINNTLHIDNDVSKDNSFANANFIFTLDHSINRGGSIVLHGYTHQYGDANSISGSEFGEKGYNTEKEIRGRLESAITLATKVNIPPSAWETPHYRTNCEQQLIFEEYFKILYEPSIEKYNKNIITSKKNGLTKFIPTPLSYIKDNDADTMIKNIESKNSDTELSLFYHPSIEIDSVQVSLSEDGTINSTYDENSILKKIVSCIDVLGYRFKSIDDL